MVTITPTKSMENDWFRDCGMTDKMATRAILCDRAHSSPPMREKPCAPNATNTATTATRSADASGTSAAESAVRGTTEWTTRDVSGSSAAPTRTGKTSGGDPGQIHL